jgi:DNA-binding MarR family transcriptional regulator
MHLMQRLGQIANTVFSKHVNHSVMTSRQFAVLTAISRNPGVNQTELVAVTGVDRSTMAEVIKRLIQKGMVKRKRSKEDTRAYAVSLMPAGAELLASVEPAVQLIEKQILSSLSQRERALMLDMMQRLSAAYPAA